MKYKDLKKSVDDIFSQDFKIKKGGVLPGHGNISLGAHAVTKKVAMIFIDIKASTKINIFLSSEIAAKMYQSFFKGISEIAILNGGSIRSFNGDGVLIVFDDDKMYDKSVITAFYLTWFMREILAPKVESLLKRTKGGKDLKFSFGIGIDMGNAFIVRGGIKGDNNNDLVWTGNIPNFAVKLASNARGAYHISISDRIYDNLSELCRQPVLELRDVWQGYNWTYVKEHKIYCTKYYCNIENRLI